MVSDDPFAQYYSDEKESAEDPFSAYYSNEAPEESYLGSFKRSLARTSSRVAETALGMPGDLLNLLKNATIYGAEKIKGSEISPEIKKTLESTAPFKLIPTSQDVREFISEKTKGYTEPRGESEKISDEIAQLSTALFIPGKDPTKFKDLAFQLGKSIAKGGAAVGAKEISKGFGASEGEQAVVEMGTLLLTSLIKPNAANKYAGTLYQDAKSMVKGTKINTGKLSGDLAKTEAELVKGDMTATKKKVLESLNNLKDKASKGKMDVGELTDFYKDINETLSSNNLFDQFQGLSKTEKKLLRQRYDMVRDDIRNTLKEYGKINPDFYNSWSKANEVYSTIAQSKRLSNFIKKHASKGIAGALFGAVEFPNQIIPAGQGIAAAFVGLKTGELMYRITKSPELRKYYADVLKQASLENIPAMNQSLMKLEKGLETLNVD